MDLGAVGSSLISLESENMRFVHTSWIFELWSKTRKIFQSSWFHLHDFSTFWWHALKHNGHITESRGTWTAKSLQCGGLEREASFMMATKPLFFCGQSTFTLVYLVGLVVALMISNIVVCWMHLPKVFFALFYFGVAYIVQLDGSITTTTLLPQGMHLATGQSKGRRGVGSQKVHGQLWICDPLLQVWLWTPTRTMDLWYMCILYIHISYIICCIIIMYHI